MWKSERVTRNCQSVRVRKIRLSIDKSINKCISRPRTDRVITGTCNKYRPIVRVAYRTLCQHITYTGGWERRTMTDLRYDAPGRRWHRQGDAIHRVSTPPLRSVRSSSIDPHIPHILQTPYSDRATLMESRCDEPFYYDIYTIFRERVASCIDRAPTQIIRSVHEPEH